MTAKDIFCLVVRLSGYFIALFAVYTTLSMVIGPASFGFNAFLYTTATGAFGVAVIKLAPAVGDFSYGSDPGA